MRDGDRVPLAIQASGRGVSLRQEPAPVSPVLTRRKRGAARPYCAQNERTGYVHSSGIFLRDRRYVPDPVRRSVKRWLSPRNRL